MYYRSFLYVLTTHVTVCVCHTEIKGNLLTYLLTTEEVFSVMSQLLFTTALRQYCTVAGFHFHQQFTA